MKKFSETFLLFFLKSAAQLQLKKSNPVIIGITGSAGKSSAVQATGLVLSQHFQTKYTKKGNSETGIPLEILDIPVENYSKIGWIKVLFLAIFQLIFNWKKYTHLVLEMGIDSETAPKNMEYLLTIVKPHIGVLLNVNAVHGENFSGDNPVVSIANEKGKLLTRLSSKDLAIFTVDQPEVEQLIPNIHAETKTFSIDKKTATIYLTDHSTSLSGTTFQFILDKQKYTLQFNHQLHFKESFGTFATALLIANHLGMKTEKAIEILEKKYKLQPGRMSIIEGIKETTILDSSYNSSLSPTSAALRMIAAFPQRKIVVLGDMRELGKKTAEDHQALAKVAAKSADFIITVGPLMKQFFIPELITLGFPKDKIHSVETAYEAVPILKSLMKKDDLILVKGSQNTIFLEIVVKALMKYPEKATQVLCRQSAFWDEQRTALLNK